MDTGCPTLPPDRYHPLNIYMISSDWQFSILVKHYPWTHLQAAAFGVRKKPVPAHFPSYITTLTFMAFRNTSLFAPQPLST